MLRLTLMAGAAVGGLALAMAFPSIPETGRSLLGMASTPAGAARSRRRWPGAASSWWTICC